MSEDIVLDDLKQQESSVYSVVKKNEYELPDYSSVRVTKQSQPPVLPVKKSNYQKVWSAPMIAIIVLQCLIMVLLMITLCMCGFIMSTKDSSCDLTSGNLQNVVQLSCIPNFAEWSDLFDKLSNSTSVTPNFDEWADGIAKRVYDKVENNTTSFPNFTEWADGVAQNVIHKIEDNTPSFPNLTEWADGVAQNVIHKIEGNTPSFPNLTEWADGVAQNVIHKIEGNTPSFPNFTEWADGMAQNVIHKIEGNTPSFPNLTEWADGVAQNVIHKIEGNTPSFPNFTEWADGMAQNVIHKIEDNTPSFPNLTEWADGVAQNVIHKIEGNIPSFPNFTEWADGVAQNVIHKIEGNTPSFPNLTEWADGVAQNVIHKIEGNTPSFPNFTEWADGVAQNVIHKIEGNTPSFPNFTEWADGVAQNVIHKIEGNIPSFPNFTEWADGVAQNVIHKIEGNTPSFPNFTEWADGVAQNVIHKIEGNTSSFPNFTEWADGVAQNVIHKIEGNTSSFPNFTEWADGVAQNVIHKIEGNTPNFPNFTEWADGVAQNVIHKIEGNTKDDLIEKLNGISVMLSNVHETSSSMASVVNDLLLGIEELLLLYNSSFNVLAQSCVEIKDRRFDSPSGMYLLKNPNNGSTYDAYCNMEELCRSGGGWTRLAYLNMSDATQNCPFGFRLYQSGGVRACGRPVTNSGSCVSVQFPSNGISYSEVCGRVVGYQYGSPDAVFDGHGYNHNNLNGDYVDGVSITRGSPRQHVWTLIAGYTQLENRAFSCPCFTGNYQQIQTFIGSHSFCESGNPAKISTSVLYPSDPLWDGQGCGFNETACCSVPGLPWFHRDYGNTTTTDYLELRVCGDEGTGNEDVPVGYYEIYVK